MNPENIDMLDPLGLNSELTVNNSMFTFKKEHPPKGNRHSVIAFIVPAGTHKEEYPGKAPTMVKKILVIYELKDRRTDGKRFMLNKKWTFSMAETANMRKDINGMGIETDEDFDIRSLTAHNFMVNVTHEKNKAGEVIKSKPGQFTSMVEGLEPIAPEATELPDWAKVYISESVEYKQKFPGDTGPYAEAIKKSKERAAKYGNGGGNSAPIAGLPPASEEEDDLPF